MRPRDLLAKGLAIGAAAIAALAALAYLGLCAWFAANHRGFIFLPMQRASTPPAEHQLTGIAEVIVPTEDGERLYGWWRAPQPGHGAVVLLTGKGVVLSDYAPLIADLIAHGFGVLGIDYRGNRPSTGVPSEKGLRADARAAFDFVRGAAPDAKVAVIGESLGTGFAVGLATERPVAGVVLNSPYASVRRLFELRGWPLPYRLLMSDQLDTEALIGRLGVPVVIMHGTADHAVPIDEARRLYRAAREPKTLLEVEGANHAEVWVGDTRDRALAALALWTRP